MFLLLLLSFKILASSQGWLPHGGKMEVVVLNFTTALDAIERETAFTAAAQWGRGGLLML